MANQYKYFRQEQAQEIKEFINSTIKPYVQEEIIQPIEAYNNSSNISATSPSLYADNLIGYAVNFITKLIGSSYGNTTDLVTNHQHNYIPFNHTELALQRDKRASSSEETKTITDIKVDPTSVRSLILPNNNCLTIGVTGEQGGNYTIYGKCSGRICDDKQNFDYTDPNLLTLTKGQNPKYQICLYQTNENNKARVEYKFIQDDTSDMLTKVFKVKCDVALPLFLQREGSVYLSEEKHHMRENDQFPSVMECAWKKTAKTNQGNKDNNPSDNVDEGYESDVDYITPVGVIDFRDREYRSTTDSSDKNTEIPTINIDNNSGNTWGITIGCSGAGVFLFTLIAGYKNRDYCKKIFNRQVDLSMPGFGIILDDPEIRPEIVIDPVSLPLSGENHELCQEE